MTLSYLLSECFKIQDVFKQHILDVSRIRYSISLKEARDIRNHAYKRAPVESYDDTKVVVRYNARGFPTTATVAFPAEPKAGCFWMKLFGVEVWVV